MTEILRAVVGAPAPRCDALEGRVYGNGALVGWGEEGVLECEGGVEEGLLLGGRAGGRRRRRQHAVEVVHQRVGARSALETTECFGR